VGITGVDYAVAETGSCVLFASAKVNRSGITFAEDSYMYC